MNYEKLGKHERKARRQEYQTALGLLAVIKDYAEQGKIEKVKTFVEYWEQEYAQWLDRLDSAEQSITRKRLL